MAQFDVYKNKNPDTKQLFPYLLDVQADILGDFPTRVVVPLAIGTALNKTAPILSPRMEIMEIDVIMLTTQLVGVPLQVLGAKVCSIKEKRDLIISALDFLFVGY